MSNKNATELKGVGQVFTIVSILQALLVRENWPTNLMSPWELLRILPTINVWEIYVFFFHSIKIITIGSNFNDFFFLRCTQNYSLSRIFRHKLNYNSQYIIWFHDNLCKCFSHGVIQAWWNSGQLACFRNKFNKRKNRVKMPNWRNLNWVLNNFILRSCNLKRFFCFYFFVCIVS